MDSHVLLEFIIWIGVILSLIPITFKLSKLLTDVIIEKFFPITTVEIRFKKNDGTVLRGKVRLDSKLSIVAQLNVEDEKYGH